MAATLRRCLTLLITLLLAACGAEPGDATPDPASLSPAASVTSTPRATPSARATPTAIPTPSDAPASAEPPSAATPNASDTVGAFGADVFDDPDDCRHSSGAYRVAFPDAWWWNTSYQDPELGSVAACRFFSPSSFDAFSATRRNPIPSGVAIWLDYLEGGCFGFIDPVLDERELTIDGFAATVREFAQGQQRSGPPALYQVIVELTPELACEDPESKAIVATTGVDLAGDYEDNKSMLDRMLRTMEIEVPSR